MNRQSFVFVSSLVAACATESAPVSWSQPQVDGAPGGWDRVRSPL